MWSSLTPRAPYLPRRGPQPFTTATTYNLFCVQDSFSLPPPVRVDVCLASMKSARQTTYHNQTSCSRVRSFYSLATIMCTCIYLQYVSCRKYVLSSSSTTINSSTRMGRKKYGSGQEAPQVWRVFFSLVSRTLRASPFDVWGEYQPSKGIRKQVSGHERPLTRVFVLPCAGPLLS